MTDQLELGACGHTTRIRSYGGGTIGAENISGPGAIGVAPDPANDWIGVADMANATDREGGLMPNPQKAKGDRAEVALVTYLQAWWPNVRRTKAGGEKDLGDLSGLIDRDGDEWCVQVADRKILLAQHGAVIVKAREAAQQAERLGAPLWCMVVKRAGCTDPADWFVWLPFWMLAEATLKFFDAPAAVTGSDLACITVRDWVALIAPEPF